MKLNIYISEKQLVTVKQLDIFTYDHDTVQMIFVYNGQEYIIRGKHPGDCVKQLKEMLEKNPPKQSQKWPGMP